MTPPGEASVAYIGLGSNLGDRKQNLKEAIKEMESSEATNLVSVSCLYLTEPVEVEEPQNDFLNAVIKIRTNLSPQALLSSLKEIEKRFGRGVDSHLKPRNLDLDILLYDDLILQTESLTIPHPRLSCREFVLAPLLELEPELQNPVDGKSLNSYYEKLKGQEKASLFEDENWWRG
ncbi:MAG: 2-amino-4-hydroxy-6-hydroxymethyldihydropteridine diphosphokinase [Candidatus Zixiibacteriota bacterium]